MMGYNHVSCGLVTGLATLPVAPVTGPAAQTAWVLALGGASLAPDLDAPGATASRMWGPLTGVLSAAIAALARGHRRGTHDALISPAAFAAAALLASLHPFTTGVVLALTIGLTLRGLALAGVGRVGATSNVLISSCTAWVLVSSGAQQVQLLPVVLALGVLIHIAGDWLTNEGVPIPVVWALGERRRLSVGLFRVNGVLERAAIAPILSAAGVLLLLTQLGIHDVPSLVSTVGLAVDALLTTVPW